MALTPDDVGRLARLARIELQPDERERLAPQLDVILDAVAQVSQVATPDVPATSHAVPLVNVFRADEVQPSLAAADALAMAPATDEGRFRVPRILGEES